MELRPLGRTGVQVSPLCLGAMMFGDWGTKDHEESIRIIHRALEAGINFIDTADVYSAGESEEIVGKAIAGRRDDIVLATKVHMPMGEDANRRGNSRRWIIAEVDNSLRRLGTDWIDVYQVHRYDPAVDLEVTLGALTDLVRAGKIRYFGHSTWPVSAIVEAQWTAERRALDRPWTEQPTYSVLTRGIEKDVLPTCARYGYGVLSYSPLAGGWLSGRYRKDEQSGPTSWARQRLANRFDLSLPENERKLDAAEALAQLADKAGITLIELAIAFVLRHPAISSAIIGPRTLGHLESQLTAPEVNLSDEVLDAIDAIVAPGVTLNPADDGWVSPALDPAARRR
jgi:aryl-alcohol dehydrogenase-like predicted oxidoreductase